MWWTCIFVFVGFVAFMKIHPDHFKFASYGPVQSRVATHGLKQFQYSTHKVWCRLHKLKTHWNITLHTWSIYLLLTAVNCGTLDNPANGQVNHNAGTTFGQTATYHCNTGYNLIGDSSRTCQSTGVWCGSEPTCQGILVCMYVHHRFIWTSLHDTRCIQHL